MAGDKTPSVHALEKPEKLQDLLKADRGDDCTPCRVVGKFVGFFRQSHDGVSSPSSLNSLPRSSDDPSRQQQQQPPTSRGADCMSCRVTGGGAFLGLSAYSYWSGMNQLERQQAKILASGSRFGMRSRKLGITATSVGLAWLGIWRMFM
ncbi:hypothetical protein PG993_004750 [Apiospora rasikravindrae]|uniref:Distal membrane-arm assembly complex protein 1-like domain-containing protein n=1 Tax=Apiospora rasikravindrae TaxID=990691 RepID=A0ABR1TDM6_9PEZI